MKYFCCVQYMIEWVRGSHCYLEHSDANVEESWSSCDSDDDDFLTFD